jgi:hypothetical protein
MADTPVDTTPDVEDISLISTDIAPKDAPSEPAEESQEAAADTQDDEGQQSEETPEGDKQAPDQDQNPAPDDAAERRRQNDLAAQRRIQERQRTQQQVAAQLDETYGPKTQDQLMEEGMDAQAAQIEALRSEIAYKEARARVAELNAGLQADAVNVENDFPVFNPKSPDYDEDFAQMVQKSYATAARLQTDESGKIVLNAEIPLYDYYQQMANIYSRGASKGTQQGQTEALQMLSRTEDVGGGAPSKTGDSLADLEERLGDVVIT